MNPNRKPIIAGNWKMHKTRHKARELAEAIVAAVKHHQDLPEIVLCPPFTALLDVVQVVQQSPVKVGAQNMEHRANGAFTGEISPTMLTDLGVGYIIIGHSERRQYHGETDELINGKLQAALRSELTPILCVGESLEVRQAGDHVPHCMAQLEIALKGISVFASPLPAIRMTTATSSAETWA